MGGQLLIFTSGAAFRLARGKRGLTNPGAREPPGIKTETWEAFRKLVDRESIV